MVANKRLSLSIFCVFTLCLVACGGGSGGSSDTNSTTSPTSPIENSNETPVVSTIPAVAYTTSVEQNLSILNEGNLGKTISLSPVNKTTQSAIEPSYSVSSYESSGLSFRYILDEDKIVMVDYNKLTNKVIQARIDTEKSTLSCQNNKWTPTGCEGINVIYDDRTGNSTILFNNKQFEQSYYQDSTASSDSEEVKYQVTVNGTVKGSITSKPLVYSDFEKTHTGQITIDGKEMDIFRAFMRDTQLFIQFTNGESLYLLTGKSSGLISGYNSTEGSFLTSSFGTLKTLPNDRVNVKFNNIYFSSDSGSKRVSGDITLIDSYAKISFLNIGQIETKYVYGYELSNTEMTYFITSTSGYGYITVQGQSPVSININGYSCTLSDCKNVAISKDGTYIKLNGTLLSGVSVTGTIRTNIH
ncbi:hypothetical protein [Acinetobacter puyangensis]|uniref:hypothetical protein n=1 Tax=Acinetobacter puyangensis TaxID=1096779 RepID=UPI003A4E16FF